MLSPFNLSTFSLAAFQPASLSSVATWFGGNIYGVTTCLIAASNRFFVPSQKSSKSSSWQWEDATKTKKNWFRVSFYSATCQTLLCFNDATSDFPVRCVWFWVNLPDFACTVPPPLKANESVHFAARKWVWMGRWDIVSKTSLASDVKFEVQCFLHFPVPFRVSPCISISSDPLAPAPAQSEPKWCHKYRNQLNFKWSKRRQVGSRNSLSADLLWQCATKWWKLMLSSTGKRCNTGLNVYPISCGKRNSSLSFDPSCGDITWSHVKVQALTTSSLALTRSFQCGVDKITTHESTLHKQCGMWQNLVLEPVVINGYEWIIWLYNINQRLYLS